MFVAFRSLVQAVSMIQNNARDLGELQKKVDSWHNMGLDEREIAIRSKDEQLRSKTHSIFSLNLIPREERQMIKISVCVSIHCLVSSPALFCL